MTVQTSLETKKTPLASTVYIILRDHSAHLEAGLRKTSFRSKTIAFLPSCHVMKRKYRSDPFRKYFGLVTYIIMKEFMKA